MLSNEQRAHDLTCVIISDTSLREKYLKKYHEKYKEDSKSITHLYEFIYRNLLKLLNDKF